MNPALQAIHDYIDTLNTDYALLLSGPWGSGKTHFWNFSVCPAIRGRLSSRRCWRPLYATFYGYPTSESITTQLLLASYPQIQKMWTKCVSSAGRGLFGILSKYLLGFDLPSIDLRSFVNTDSAVICFDDLERANLPLDEALGYISHFLDLGNSKVIILANEDALLKEDEKRRIYEVMKEKVVGVSVCFRQNESDLFRSLLIEFQRDPRCGEFFSSHEEMIRRLCVLSDTRNIRSNRRALAVLSVAVKELIENAIDVHSIYKNLIYAVIPTVIEYHDRRCSADAIRELHKQDHMFGIGIPSSRDVKAITGKQEEINILAGRYLPGFVLADWADAVSCPPICEFVLTGILDHAQFLDWARQRTAPPDSLSDGLSRLRSDARMLDDEEFRELCKNVLREINDGQLSHVSEYFHALGMFADLSEHRLVPESTSELALIFNRGLDLAIQAGALVESKTLDFDVSERPRSQPRPECTAMLERIKKINAELRLARVSKIIEHAHRLMQKDPGAFLSAISAEGEHGYRLVPVFESLEPQRLCEWILALPNATKSRVRWALKKRYIDSGYSGHLRNEAPVWAEAAQLMDAKCKRLRNSEGVLPISLMNVEPIVTALDEIRNHLEGEEPMPVHPDIEGLALPE